MQTEINTIPHNQESISVDKVITVDEFEAARALGVSVDFLRKDRRSRNLIPYYRIGRRVLYNLDRIKEILPTFELINSLPVCKEGEI